jgi:methionyl aminopeptidase
MSIETHEQLFGMQAAGAVVARALAAMRRAVRPGVTTAELDRVAADVFDAAGARSGPQLDYDFPGITCISVNDEAIHGIPGPRVLEPGDLVKLDVTAELNGFYADACDTVPVGGGSHPATELVASARRALAAAMRVATAGAPLNGIGAAVERSVTSDGFAVCAELTGHGIGRRSHEEPTVANTWLPQFGAPLREGLVLTIEPVIAAGSGMVRSTNDGWTVRTVDRSLSAHVEHTVVIRRGRPLVLTAPPV